MRALAAGETLNSLQSDESLIWSLQAFDDHHRAVEFVRHFKSSLCIYSSKVLQLYAQYDVVVPEGKDQELVVIPDLEAFTETFYDIPVKAIVKTGYTILPGSSFGKTGLYLHMAEQGGTGKGSVLPLAAGLEKAAELAEQTDDDFLPVLTKGDLRVFRKQAPMLHLHRIDLNVMQDKSRFEINDIKSTVRKKLHGLPE